MLKSTKGTVYAAEGSVVLDIEPPPRTLADAMKHPDEDRGFTDILLETGINMGPVEVEVLILPSEPERDITAEWDDAWEDFDLSLPAGKAHLHGPTVGEMLEIGTIERPSLYRFRICANGRSSMRDLVTTEPVETYLVQAWEVA
ncbi:hypothetical protein AB0N71_01705 [Pseudarthrobacter enclensis]|uniref:hypothetical protein n=1 Tax=Pseudarthrobacter enclensis TaxID=993070 RepID=UPI003445002D